MFSGNLGSHSEGRVSAPARRLYRTQKESTTILRGEKELIIFCGFFMPSVPTQPAALNKQVKKQTSQETWLDFFSQSNSIHNSRSGARQIPCQQYCRTLHRSWWSLMILWRNYNYAFLSITQSQLPDLQSSRRIIIGLVTYQGGAPIHLKATPCCERTSKKLISNYRRWFRVVRRFSQALLFIHPTSPAERRTFKTNNHKHVSIEGSHRSPSILQDKGLNRMSVESI